MSGASNEYISLCLYLSLAVISLAVYLPVRNFDFVNYDDDVYVTENPHIHDGLTIESLRHIFTTGYAANWHPVTWLSHLVDIELFGLKAGRHHLHNLLLHTANTLLLFSVLMQMTNRRWHSAFVAALFALHPVHVESVAWIAERKDVLSTLFALLTIIAFVRYLKKGRAGWYFLSLVLFSFGLMAKPMLVTLPFVLLLLDYWPLGRFETDRPRPVVFWRLFKEKLPFFVLSAISCVITFLVQQSAGAVKHIEALSLPVRIGNAFVSYIAYILKTFWPVRLAVFYPHECAGLPVWRAVGAAVLLLAISLFVIRKAKRFGWLFVGWFWYIGTLVPVIGIIQVGNQAMADRYSYVPLIGVFLIIAFGFEELVRKSEYKKVITAVFFITAITACAICSRLQLRYWKDSLTLFNRAIEVTKDNYVMHNNMGSFLASEGSLPQAVGHYKTALQIKPDYAQAHFNLARAYQQQHRFSRAIEHYKKAIEIRADYAAAHNNLANIYKQTGRIDMALSHFNRAIEAKNDFAEAHYNLANLLKQLGRINEAVTCYRRAIEAGGADAEVYNNLAGALLQLNRPGEAVDAYQKAVEIDADYFAAHNNLAVVFLRNQQFDSALEHFEKALILAPNEPATLVGLAEVLMNRPDPKLCDAKRAVELAEKAAELTGYENPTVLETLAAAYAAAGDVDSARRVRGKLNSYRGKRPAELIDN